MHDSQVKHESPAYTRSKCGNHGDDLDCKKLTTDFRASVDVFRHALPHLPRPGRVVEGDTPRESSRESRVRLDFRHFGAANHQLVAVGSRV
jgi:hypothetical protein